MRKVRQGGKDNYHVRRIRALELMLPNSAMLIFASYWDMTEQGHKQLDDMSPQLSDFFYLSGFKDKDSCMLLIHSDGHPASQFLFCPEPSEFIALWTGGLKPPEQVAKELLFDKGLPVAEFEDFLKTTLKGIANFYYPLGKNGTVDEKINALLRGLSDNGLRKGLTTPTKIINSDEILAAMRIIKSPAELSLIGRAAEITVSGHKGLMENLDSYRYEYQAEAELGYHYRCNGARHAFPPIVAGGGNSCVLHYTYNDKPLTAMDSLLVDSGAMFEHYAADMTRCYPPREDSGGINREDYISIYNVVLAVHQKVCSLATEVNKTNLEKLHTATVRYLVEELIKLSIIKEDLDTVIKDETYKKYFPHKTSHWIGLDVHDLGSYESQTLKPGMVFSIEPGLYFPPYDQSIDPRWRSIGVRIEDTIAITAEGMVNLTSGMPYW